MASKIFGFSGFVIRVPGSGIRGLGFGFQDFFLCFLDLKSSGAPQAVVTRGWSRATRNGRRSSPRFRISEFAFRGPVFGSQVSNLEQFSAVGGHALAEVASENLSPFLRVGPRLAANVLFKERLK